MQTFEKSRRHGSFYKNRLVVLSCQELCKESYAMTRQITGAGLSCPMKRDGLSNIAQRTRQASPSRSRRGMPVVPADSGWIVQRGPTDLTSRSFRKVNHFCSPKSVKTNCRPELFRRCSQRKIPCQVPSANWPLRIGTIREQPESVVLM